MRDDGTIAHPLALERNRICYAPYRGRRYFVDLSHGSFDEYLAKFSHKTRGNLKRQVRVLADGGPAEFCSFESPEGILEFRDHAVGISRWTYQRKIGVGFPETEEFRAKLLDEAAKGLVRGFLLMRKDRAVAYALCRIDSEIITYVITGYDPTLARYSPGTVLLFLILERLFAERRLRVFDFGGQESGYKALFATGDVRYVRVVWFPITAKNVGAVHYALRQAWTGAGWLKGAAARALTARPSSR